MTTRLPDPQYTTNFGAAYLGDALQLLKHLKDESVDLIMTSPPFGLRRKKEYGNVDAENYVKWFLPFSLEFYRVLKRDGSLVIDIGGAWNPGHPTKSLYNFELVVALCNQVGFYLAQDFYWFNPAKLPAPAEWVTVRRIRAKDAVDTIWWLSKSPFPRANNKKVLKPYSNSMLDLLEKGYKPKLRPSGHDISSNLIWLVCTTAFVNYLSKCRKVGLYPHFTRERAERPALLIMLTEHEPFIQWDVCACQEKGSFNCGLPGVLAGEPHERGCRYIERCDTCERYPCDEDACLAYAQAFGGRCSYDSEGYVVWSPQ